MARYKTYAKKTRLSKRGKQVKWAPFWTIPKALGKGKRVHPSRLTRLKRSWRRTKIKPRIKKQEFKIRKSGYIKKKY